ncbi:MAG: hypothetical protein AAB885_03795 [Patescibacteria group bacterium]
MKKTDGRDLRNLDNSDLLRGFFTISPIQNHQNYEGSKKPNLKFRKKLCKFCQSPLGTYNPYNACNLCIAKAVSIAKTELPEIDAKALVVRELKIHLRKPVGLFGRYFRKNLMRGA